MPKMPPTRLSAAPRASTLPRLHASVATGQRGAPLLQVLSRRRCETMLLHIQHAIRRFERSWAGTGPTCCPVEHVSAAQRGTPTPSDLKLCCRWRRRALTPPRKAMLSAGGAEKESGPRQRSPNAALAQSAGLLCTLGAARPPGSAPAVAAVALQLLILVSSRLRDQRGHRAQRLKPCSRPGRDVCSWRQTSGQTRRRSGLTRRVGWAHPHRMVRIELVAPFGCSDALQWRYA